MPRLSLRIALVALILSAALHAEIPAGYYNQANNLRGQALLNSLNTICSEGSFLGYGSGEGYTWEGFYYTDRNDDGTVIDMYSNTVRIQESFSAVDGLHIEHALPKSWWGGLENYAFRDLNHLFPADGTTNITKNALPLGEVGSATFSNGVSKIGNNTFPGAPGNCFEPADEYKGDFARAYFYVSAVYNELSNEWQSPMMNNNTYPVWNEWALELLLQWHRQDPVSPKERDRQETVYEIQHNRNPFIDYPDLVEHIWGNDTATDFTIAIETRPYLTEPSKWSRINAGTQRCGTTATQPLTIRGENITASLTAKLRNQNNHITLSHNTITPNQANSGISVDIEITAQNDTLIVDTLLIFSSEIDTIAIPLSASFTTQFMITGFDFDNDSEATITWTAEPNATSYDITIHEGSSTNVANLFISGYIEGSSWNKAIALYNGTNATIDLSHYSLGKQNNGTGGYGSSFPLSGSIAPGESFVIAHASASDALKNKANIITTNSKDDIMSFNGNDAIVLYHNNIAIDAVGHLNNSASWGADITLKRTASTIAPNTTFNESEWERFGTDDFSHIGQHSIITPTTVSSRTITGITGTTSSVALSSYPTFTAYITAQPSGDQSVNGWRIAIPELLAPVAYDATNISNTHFDIQWDKVPFASGYLLNLYQTAGAGITITTEEFNSVSSTGKNLPTGWTGDPSGNYTSAVSSGANAPSVALKNDGEWLASPIMPLPVDSISFMYRFPSNATGSYLLVFAMDNNSQATKIDSIRYTNTKKTTVEYNAAQLGNNCHGIKFEYHKASGNLAIDDVTIRYGNQTITNIVTDEYVGAEITRHTFYNLETNTTYHFHVKAISGYNTDYEMVSPNSNVIMATTLNSSTSATNKPTGQPSAIIYISDSRIVVKNSSERHTIMVFDTLGRLIFNKDNCNIQEAISVAPNAIYIVKIISHNGDSLVVKTAL